MGVRLHAGDTAHLVQDDGHSGFGDLPGGLGTGQTAADDVDWGEGGHGGLLAPAPTPGQPCGPAHDQSLIRFLREGR